MTVYARIRNQITTVPSYPNGLKIGAYLFPKNDGSSGQALITNGSGTVSWGNAGAQLSGTNTWTGTQTLSLATKSDRMLGKYIVTYSTANRPFDMNYNLSFNMTDALAVQRLATIVGATSAGIPEANWDSAYGSTYGTKKVGLGFHVGTYTQITREVSQLTPTSGINDNVNAVIFGYMGTGPRIIASDYDLMTESLNTIRYIATKHNFVAGDVVIGSEDNLSTATNGFLRGSSGIAGSTDIPGANLTIAAGASTGAGVSGNLIFQTAPASTTTGSALNSYIERMRITSAGNVGIGTSSPEIKLEINQGISAATSYLRTTPQLLLKGFGGSSTYHSGIAFSMNEHTSGYWGSGILSYDDTGSYGSALTFYTSTGFASPLPTEKMRITSSGQLFIGTNTDGELGRTTVAGIKTFVVGIPRDQLNIRDTTSQAQGVGGAINFLGSYNLTTPTSFASIEAYKENSTDGHYGASLLFKTRQNGGNQNEWMRITSSGNVGIGTSSPLRALEINNALRLTNSSADVNDGVIGTATFASGLNIVGINTDGAGRKINFWGSFIQNENAIGNSLAFTTFTAGINFKATSVSANTTLDYSYTHVFASGTITITLPTAVGIAGRTYWIKRTGTGTITISTTSSQTIDGAASLLITTQYDSYTLVSDGSNWFIM